MDPNLAATGIHPYAAANRPMGSQTPITTPTVAAVIRTLNESALLGSCIEALRAQEGGIPLELVVVDSGSVDGTVEIASRAGARVIEIDPAEFDYSRALNLGILHTAAELVIVLSAHAVPVDAYWLERMVAPFADPGVAGVAARQIPWPDADWHELLRLECAFPPARHVFASTDEPIFSNAAACIRRSVWSEFPFVLPAVEDLDWARRVLRAGRTIVYEPAATVRHSHDESAEERALRLIDISRVHRAGSAEALPWLRTLREAAALVRRDLAALVALDAAPATKLRYAAGTLATARAFVARYGEAGSTAERR